MKGRVDEFYQIGGGGEGGWEEGAFSNKTGVWLQF